MSNEKKYEKYYEKYPIRILDMGKINKSGKKPRGRGELKKEKERIKKYLKDTNQKPIKPSFGIQIEDLKSKGGSIKKYSRGGGVAIQGTKFKGSY